MYWCYAGTYVKKKILIGIFNEHVLMWLWGTGEAGTTLDHLFYDRDLRGLIGHTRLFSLSM